MRLISWNVNGLRAAINKGFADTVAQLDPDILCLQETKLQAGQIASPLPQYHDHWNYALRPGYSGTAIFTRRQPLSVTHGIGEEEHDREGRVITLTFSDYTLVTVYTPNSQDGLRRLDYRLRWEDAFRRHIRRLQATRPVIICGDLNVAHQDIDLARPATNHHNPGFSDEEREQFRHLLDLPLIDTYRHLHPDTTGAYSWWSYRFHAREKNIGWRIDYFLISPGLLPRLQTADIHTHITGSDHCPVQIELQ